MTDGWGGKPPILSRAGFGGTTPVIRQHPLFLGLDLAPPLGLLVAVVAIAAWKAPIAFSRPSFTAFVMIVAAWAAAAFGRWYTTTLTLTQGAVEVRRGLAMRSSCIVPIAAIQELITRQSVFGRLVGYGTLIICLYSGTQEELARLPRPAVLRDLILFDRNHGTTPGALKTVARSDVP